MEAAGLVFADLGYARTTTDKIAARAGVSVGSLYQYFPDKDALVHALLERHHAEVHRVVEAALEQLANPEIPLPDGLRFLLEALIRLHAEDPALSRFLGEVLPAAAGHDDSRRGEGDRYVREIERLLRSRPEVRVPNPTIAATILVRTVESLTRWLVHDSPPGLDERSFVDETIRMLDGFLFGSAPRGRIA